MTTRMPRTPAHEHSVPLFWPIAAAIEMEEEGLRRFQDNMQFTAEAVTIEAPPPPEWASANRVVLDLDTVRLREFSPAGARYDTLPTMVDAPYAGHSSTIADYGRGQSLVETLLASGIEHVLVTDWKSATPAMRDYDIDSYLSDIDAAVESLGGRVNLIGLCQGGWMSAMYACRFSNKGLSGSRNGIEAD